MPAAAFGGDPNCEAAVADRLVLAPDGENEGPPGAAVFQYDIIIMWSYI